jgi:hypothetical protein
VIDDCHKHKYNKTLQSVSLARGKQCHVVNYKMSKLFKPAFAAQIHSAHQVGAFSHVLRVFHTMGLEAHTMGLAAHTMGLVAHTIGLAAS